MSKFASLALVAALAVGAATLSKPADAGVVVGVGVGLPVAAPSVVAYAPYGIGYYPGGYWRGPRYVHPGYWRGYRGGYGYHRGYGYHGRWR